MNFRDTTEALSRGCPGSQGAAIIDPDGIPVAVHPQDGSLEVLGGEFASILKHVGEAGRELEHGALQQLVIYAERAVVILTTTGGGYFLVLVLSRLGSVGKGKFCSRLLAERLFSEFV